MRSKEYLFLHNLHKQLMGVPAGC